MILNAVIERDTETGLLVGSVPGLPGAHTQGATFEEVRQNLADVIELLRHEGALQRFAATSEWELKHSSNIVDIARGAPERLSGPTR